MLLAAGVPLMYVARRVGHLDSTTTSKIYAHAEKTDSVNLGVVFDSILDGTREFSAEQLLKAQQKAISYSCNQVVVVGSDYKVTTWINPMMVWDFAVNKKRPKKPLFMGFFGPQT